MVAVETALPLIATSPAPPAPCAAILPGREVGGSLGREARHQWRGHSFLEEGRGKATPPAMADGAAKCPSGSAPSSMDWRIAPGCLLLSESDCWYGPHCELSEHSILPAAELSHAQYHSARACWIRCLLLKAWKKFDAAIFLHFEHPANDFVLGFPLP
eukprot:CAMPEP_0117827524 /NCGR_PEP_ID=MMETSP0949-20121206/6739_1 /TAXON_ID=44440 /ORGANISM="Chattonella subsalsa, Strain CCMP2191" /LENGTH=157 /DNA_ID=CAMNT_0005667935 /DNA_START=9 /DNA_END=482 /DNA_ORIENTATION=-